MVFFQNYYWFKKSDPIFSSIENTSDLFPILTDHYFKECILAIRPKLKLYQSYEQAKEEVSKLQQELYPNLFSENETDALGTIAEEGHDHTDTNNENTEDTSEALGSDDEVRQRRTDDENSPDEYGTDAGGTDALDDDVCTLLQKKKSKMLFFKIHFFSSSLHPTNQILPLYHAKNNVLKKILNLKKCSIKCTLTVIKNGYVNRLKPAKILPYQ